MKGVYQGRIGLTDGVAGAPRPLPAMPRLRGSLPRRRPLRPHDGGDPRPDGDATPPLPDPTARRLRRRAAPPPSPGPPADARLDAEGVPAQRTPGPRPRSGRPPAHWRLGPTRTAAPPSGPVLQATPQAGSAPRRGGAARRDARRLRHAPRLRPRERGDGERARPQRLRGRRPQSGLLRRPQHPHRRARVGPRPGPSQHRRLPRRRRRRHCRQLRRLRLHHEGVPRAPKGRPRLPRQGRALRRHGPGRPRVPRRPPPRPAHRRDARPA